jgi:toxin FitB
MVIVDSSGWLEWFTDGRIADAYQKYLADQDTFWCPRLFFMKCIRF